MRIGVHAHLLSTRPGYRRTGVSRYIERLLAALPEALAADEALVVYAGSAAAAHPWFAPAWERRGPAVPTERPARRALWEQTVLPVLARRDRLDVLHGPVNIAPLLVPCPTVVTVHDLAYLRLPDRLPAGRRRYFSALTRASARRAARVLAVSESTKRDVVELLEVPEDRVAVTPLAADAGFRPVTGEALDAFLGEQRIVRPFVLSVGTLEPRKNLPALLRAFGRIAPEVPHDLVLAGPEGWMTDEIHETRRRLGLGDRVRFTGYVETAMLPAWYSAADLFVYPSLYEGFGLPPLEAMACGTPVVTSDVSSLPEVVGDAALTVPPTEETALAEAMRRVLEDRVLAADLQARGLERAREFSWRRTAALTVAAYREAVG
ncbi:MAG: glycosyltransferase family 4 protein [Chloroflexota bacterium]|nr:glycosyltransferase family 4 protein [Chloroflexota bacterium]